MTNGLIHAGHYQRDYYRYLFYVIPEENYHLTGQTTLLNEVWAPDFAVRKIEGPAATMISKIEEVKIHGA